MSSNTAKVTSQVILFSLDNIYDYSHSLQKAMADVQEAYQELSAFTQKNLAHVYISATQAAEYIYFQKRFPAYKDINTCRVQVFFSGLGLPKPSTKKCQEFLAIFDKGYRNSQRPLPGAIDTMTQLREKGHSVSVLVKGTGEYDLVRCEALGIRHLVDFLLTEEEASKIGPTIRIFGNNAEGMVVPLGPHVKPKLSIKEDVRQALADGMTAVLYKSCETFGYKKIGDLEVPVISAMGQLLNVVDSACSAQPAACCASS